MGWCTKTPTPDQRHFPIFALFKLTPHKLLIRHFAHIRLSLSPLPLPTVSSHCHANCNEATTYMGMAWAGIQKVYKRSNLSQRHSPYVPSINIYTSHLANCYIATTFSTHYKLSFSYLTFARTVPLLKIYRS